MSNTISGHNPFAAPFSISTLRDAAASLNDDQTIILNRDNEGNTQNPPLLIGTFNGHEITNETERQTNRVTQDAVFAALGAERDASGCAIYTGTAIDHAFAQAGFSSEIGGARGEPVTGARLRIILNSLDAPENAMTNSSGMTTRHNFSTSPAEADDFDIVSVSSEESSDLDSPLVSDVSEMSIGSDDSHDNRSELSEEGIEIDRSLAVNRPVNAVHNRSHDAQDWMNSQAAPQDMLAMFRAQLDRRSAENQRDRMQNPNNDFNRD